LTAKIEVSVEMVDKCRKRKWSASTHDVRIIGLLGSWKSGNNLSGINVVCFKYEYVLFLFSSMKCRPWWRTFD